MPRPGPRRPAVTIRLDPDHAAWLVAEAERRNTSQGAIIRELIAQAREVKRGTSDVARFSDPDDTDELQRVTLVPIENDKDDW